MRITAKELAIILDAQIDGNPDCAVNKLAKIEEADELSLCFIANPKYEHFAETTHAGILVVSNDFRLKNNNGTTFLRVEDPYASFAFLLEKFSHLTNTAKQGVEAPSFIHDTTKVASSAYVGAFTYVGKNVQIADGVQIYPNCYVGDNSIIGKNTVIYSGVHLYQQTEIGQECIIHSGVVIGSDGFGFVPEKDGTYKKIPQTGKVKIGNKVEIGANTVIDRATLGNTLVADGVKLDNLVQIAHNVELGENTVVASQAGISGSTKLGKNVMVGGQAGFVGHITIADNVKINAQSGVSKTVKEKGSAISGSPAESFRKHYKGIANTRRLSELIMRIEKLEEELHKNNS